MMVEYFITVVIALLDRAIQYSLTQIMERRVRPEWINRNRSGMLDRPA